MAYHGLHNEKQSQRPQQHGPVRINRHGESERKRGGDEGADVGNEAKDRRQNAPQNRTRNPDKPETHADDDAEGSVQQKLDQEQASQTRRRVVQRGGGTLEVT